MNTDFGVPVINILWTIVAGKRFQLEDPQVQRMMSLLNRSVVFLTNQQLVIFQRDEVKFMNPSALP